MEQELAKYGGWGVAIGALILVYKIVCEFNRGFKHSIDANTQATTEMHEFLKGLNGRLKAVVSEKLEGK